MPTRLEPFVNANIYHIFNKTIDQKRVFQSDKYSQEFYQRLIYYRSTNSTRSYSDIDKLNKETQEIINQDIFIEKDYQIKVLSYSFMPNHYHMLLSPLTKNGIPLFMKKFNGGYAKYFNERYNRTGALFEGKYKRIIIKNEAHFIHIPYYIHLNPLDLITPEWREKKLHDFNKAIKFLESYRWSSHMDYLGVKNFPSVTQREFLFDIFGSNKQYGQKIEEWLEDLYLTQKLDSVRDYVLER